MTKELYLVPCKHGNYARQYGQSIIVAQAKVGHKYITVCDNKNYRIDGRKFDVEYDEDENGNEFYDEVSEYTSDFYAYDTVEGAEEYLERDVLLTSIKQYDINRLPLDVLRDISSVLESHTQKVIKK